MKRNIYVKRIDIKQLSNNTKTKDLNIRMKKIKMKRDAAIKQTKVVHNKNRTVIEIDRKV